MSLANRRYAGITDYEYAVLQLLAAGMTRSEIADERSVKPAAIRQILTTVRSKIAKTSGVEINSDFQLACILYDCGVFRVT